MKIKRLILGPLEENCYIITIDNKTIIIDPGAESNKIISECKSKNIVGILITHHHFDHIGALKEIEKYFKIKETKQIKDINYEIIKTPGHTSDSLTYYFPEEKIMFTGDFLFKGSIGRYDMPTGSYIDIKNSLKKLSYFPDEIIIYPGHGDKTTLGIEKQNFKYY